MSTGKLLDPRLTIGQIIALRFAPDLEFAALAQRAVAESQKLARPYLSRLDNVKSVLVRWKLRASAIL